MYFSPCGSMRSSIRCPSRMHCQCTNLLVSAQAGMVPAVRVQACGALLLRRLLWRTARCALPPHKGVACSSIKGVATVAYQQPPLYQLSIKNHEAKEGVF